MNVMHIIRGCAAGMIALGLATPANALPLDEARHVLGRVAFAATPNDANALAPLDRTAAVQQLLGTARQSALTEPPGWSDTWTPRRRRDRPMSAEDRAERPRAAPTVG